MRTLRKIYIPTTRNIGSLSTAGGRGADQVVTLQRYGKTSAQAPVGLSARHARSVPEAPRASVHFLAAARYHPEQAGLVARNTAEFLALRIRQEDHLEQL